MGNSQNTNDEIEIDLLELFYVLRSKLLVIILSTLVAATAVGLFSKFLISPTYASTTKMYILSMSTSITSFADIQIGNSLTQDYMELIKSRPVVQEVIDNLNLDVTYQDMLKKVTITNPSDTRILCITVEDHDPVLAKEIVDEFASVSIDRIAEIMDTEKPNIVEEGLKYVNNDACYPTILTVGQIMNALNSGKYDLDSTAVIITQTGGGCRATNYIAMIKKAIRDAGYHQIPVLSLNFVGLEKQPGFKITPELVKRAVQGILYGDMLMRVLYRVRPYEIEPGSANKLYEEWNARCKESLKRASFREYSRNMRQIVKDFDALPVHEMNKPRVGLVGEILVKFHPGANNDLVGIIESEGAEAVVPDLAGFFFFVMHHAHVRHELLDGSKKRVRIMDTIIHMVERVRRPMIKALEGTKFGTPKDIYELAELAKPVLSLGNISGEGWFLTAEMLELMEDGIYNIVCMQPFACLPNHVTGKGIMKELKRLNPLANIVAIDYDPGASTVNQLNRIRLMLSTAFKNEELEAKKAEAAKESEKEIVNV